VGLLAEASAAHQVDLLVHLLRAGEVLSAAFVVVATLEVLTEEAMEEVMAEATGKLKEKGNY
jgi:hypothetical protein